MSANGRVIVLGSINIDTQLRVEHFPQPGETIRGLSMQTGLGGKGANQAVAASRAGARAALHGAVGADDAVLERLAALAPDLDLTGVTIHPEAATGSACVMLDASRENAIIVIGGANETVSSPQGLVPDAKDICLAQLEVPVAAIAGFFRQAQAGGARTVLNTAPALPEGRALFALSDVLVMNETELAFYAGVMPDLTEDALSDTARSLLTTPYQAIIITLGAAGALYVSADHQAMLPGRKAVHVQDTTGAGDCFCGTLCASLAEGLPFAAAVARANAAASLQVARQGAAEAMPWVDEIEAARQPDRST
ncbi:ribokinase [Novosphingobium rosa]|uniref:ribokinase n=1 Tax=Novosphingobium rosa TaxID=76978 RepID=UPI0008337EAB|nr:ribokinase [Novosphingobium rosa]